MAQQITRAPIYQQAVGPVRLLWGFSHDFQPMTGNPSKKDQLNPNVWDRL
ncbi:hypothetical protein OKW98_12310 [Pseudomonas sp. KU26590]|nr:hypothetical protein [Pseudomonas sp. KU26590]UZJ62441.1 hypothetical protein OKW98_12310 [Pseudomonas sp. KU26590]